VLVLKAVRVLFYAMKYFSPFIGDTAPAVNRLMTAACGGNIYLEL
jgi:hypothetical protein